MSSVYPAPAIVVGVGRFGLALLERLGEDWAGLKISGADASIGNLRLLAVRSTAADNGWRRFEEGAVRIAGHVAGSDLPSLALDFAIVRALGLVRYRDGCYQVALPRDAGVVDVEEEGSRRLRYFEWLRLDCDPIVAAERLRQRAQQLQEVDLFITPLVNRVRQGHSPQALLACVGRCRALFQGRDPAPWDWTATAVTTESGDGDLIAPAISARDKAEMRHATRFLSKLMPPPFPGWEAWLAGAEEAPPAIRAPAPFRREPGDLAAPLDPADLLAQEWEATGWASQQEGLGEAVFVPLTPHPLQLGLFDLDTRQQVPAESLDLLRRRLRELGALLHGGLVRLWVDLQRERVGDVDGDLFEGTRQRDEASEALRQTLEVLGEIVVHPLMDAIQDVPVRDAASSAERLLPDEPSRFLRGLELPARSEESPRTWL
ncbi:MAG TPA: hypothetical protein VN923_08700, partial [Thermoanaerobaculia bacterium]|nr:hypothetical protein [Thermoanaerobaculia bacterium]